MNYDNKTNSIIAKLDELREDQVRLLLGIANKEIERNRTVTIEELKRVRELLLNDPILNSIQKNNVDAIKLSTNFSLVRKDARSIIGAAVA